MTKLVLLLAVIVTAASASPVNPCATYMGQSVLGSGFACTQDGLTFSNFSIMDAGNDPNPQMYLVNAGTDGQGNASLEFNPFLDVSGGAVQGAHFYFQVSSASLAGLTVSGVNASINELLCSGPIVMNTCGSSTTLANMVANSGSTVSASFASSSPVYVYKDIAAVSTAGQAAHLTSFTETFGPTGAGATPGSVVPEPATMLTLGTGLIFTALALKRRVRRS